MIPEFYPVKTEDGTISLYNLHVKDIYHSKIGAYTESLHKFVLPSGLIDFVCKNNEVRILDVCFGLGYNSSAAVNEILKINPQCKIIIDALEIDKNVLALAALLDDKFLFFDALSNKIDIDGLINDYFKQLRELSLDKLKLILPEDKVANLDDVLSELHNIYYRTISARNILTSKSPSLLGCVDIDFYIEDARVAIDKISSFKTNYYDFIFLDPFTPSKVPSLWTVNFFSKLHEVLNDNGNITTYSNAAPVRGGLIESGFFIGAIAPLGKKSTGTIAYKNKKLLKTYLCLKEESLLATRAGIPYRDSDFNLTSDEILKNRVLEKSESSRISSSSFFKNNAH